MGFKIDAVAHVCPIVKIGKGASFTDVYLAEIIFHAVVKTTKRYAGLSLMVWILKREVRAFGGCLGMYRR